ncbi:MAG: pilus assembly protein TadG-related protein [Phycisphaerae bacterium]|nr:pilus assembly protein TadG-related protein [Phycisphaerae bacterium]
MAKTLDNRIRASRPNRGVVLVMTLLSLVLLVGLIFYVYNVSQQVNSRLALQQSADSAAVSGATWMARSMNQVAMNNVAQTKMLSSVIVLDSLPLATEMSHNDASAWADALRAHRRMPGGLPARESALLQRGMFTLRDRMVEQRDVLATMNESLKDFPMERLTHYAGPGGSAPYGELWQATAALSELTRATVNSSGVLAQNNAVRWGGENNVGLRTAFLTPVRPTIPTRTGEFNDLRDFRYPLGGIQHVYSNRAELVSDEPSGEYAIEGGAIPDMAWPHRLGPWARLHKWRWDLFETRRVGGGGSTRPGDGVGPSGPGGSPMGGGGSRWERGRTLGYTPRGPLHWALHRIWWWAGSRERWAWEGGSPEDEWGDGGRYRIDGDLGVTPFTDYMWAFSYAKLEYMFRSQTPRKIHKPEWVTDYNLARARAIADPSQVYQVMFYHVWIESSVPPGDPNWLAEGTYRSNVPRLHVPPPDDLEHLPDAVYVRNTPGRWVDEDVGWPDPERWRLSRPSGLNVWRDDYHYETTFDPEIGIGPPQENESPWRRVYVRSYYFWVGADFSQQDVVIENPCNWSGSEWPAIAPLLLATNDGEDGDYTPDPDAGYRRRFFTFLGTAQMDTPPLVMGGAFGTGSPNGRTVAFAQAKVFNASSFDLWTQDWQAALMPVTSMDDWLNKMAAGAEQATVTGGLLSPTAVRDVHDHIRKLGKDMVQRRTRH